LVLGLRMGEEAFTLADRRFLDDLAHQIGVAAHAVRLSADLQRSRERLVTAREEERRRLRRDLHDGLGPQLAALTMRAEAARDLILSDPVQEETVLSDLIEQTQDAVDDVRRLVYALRPPALDALGLLAALRTQASHQNRGGLRITIDGPEQLPPLPAAVEVAAYRIVLEALSNVVRHAEARNCTVHLALDEAYGTLRLEVTDDGRGIGEDRGTGMGLSSMRERAAEPLPSGPPDAFSELTEREILTLVAQHQTNPEIAKFLHLSQKTVRNHVSKIFTKLQVADRAQAIIRAREAGMERDEG
jgi:signal transduction histidine kinase/DNA-binding CsgD family transcriptional regulator